VNRLKEVAIHILKGLNASDEEAALVAESLVQADMRVIDTHGVHLLTLLSDRVGGHGSSSDQPYHFKKEGTRLRSSTAGMGWVRWPSIGR
jgi:LDH2 family malate/lactate/ureidoglycolate dehydrogenase